MNNEKPERKVEFTFDFLDNEKNYTAHIFKDAPDADENPEHASVSNMTVSQADKHSVVITPGGREAIWLEAKHPGKISKNKNIVHIKY